MRISPVVFSPVINVAVMSLKSSAIEIHTHTHTTNCSTTHHPHTAYAMTTWLDNVISIIRDFVKWNSIWIGMQFSLIAHFGDISAQFVIRQLYNTTNHAKASSIIRSLSRVPIIFVYIILSCANTSNTWRPESKHLFWFFAHTTHTNHAHFWWVLAKNAWCFQNYLFSIDSRSVRPHRSFIQMFAPTFFFRSIDANFSTTLYV